MVHVRCGTDMTPYEMWKGNTPSESYFHVFDCICYIFNDKDQLGKLNAKSYDGIFLSYLATSIVFRVYNKRTRVITETANVVFDDASSQKVMVSIFDLSEDRSHEIW